MAERHPHDLKFTIFSLSRMLWVTDKPSNLDKPSRRFACDTLWVRPTNPHSFTARPCAITHTETSPQPAANPHNTHLVQEYGTPGCGISGKAPKSPPSRAPAPHAFADRSVALPSPCIASAPCLIGRPLSRLSTLCGHCPSSGSLPQITPGRPITCSHLCTT